MLPTVEKACLVCEKPFQTRIPRKKYCDGCAYVAAQLHKVMRANKVSFYKAKVMFVKKIRWCLDCGKNPVAANSEVRCSGCARAKRLELYRRWKRKQNIRFKCAKCGEPTTFSKSHHRPPHRLSQLCEKHRRVKRRLKKRLLYWHQQDIKNRKVLR